MAQTDYLSPGVFGVEVAPTRAQEGISPAKMGIVGWTEQGPVNTPIEVRSVSEFTRRFGPINSRGLVALSMRAFFGTGGQRAWVVRVAPSDAVEASVDIDTPAKWTFTANGPGEWGNDTVIRIEGNRNFLNRTEGSVGYEKFDLKVLRPTDFDPDINAAAETFEAIQFTDTLASDYLIAAMTDPRNPSSLVTPTVGAGGTPTDLLAVNVADENIGAGDALGTTQFTGTLAAPTVLDNTLTIVASDTQISDEAQTPTPALDNSATGFTFTLPSAPALDGSLRIFAPSATIVSNEAPAVTGVIDSANQAFTIAAGALSDSIHRENDVFRLKYADTASASGPTTIHTDGGGGLTHDLATTPITASLPVHPGTLSLALDVGGAQTITDDGAGNLTGTGGSLPSGGTIDYDTGVMTGVTAALTAASTIDESHNQSSIITKATSADNLATGVALAGAATGTVDLVDSVTAPTGNGAFTITTSVAPITGTLFYIDFVASHIIESDVAGALTGDVGVGTNTANFTTGAVDVEMADAPLGLVLPHGTVTLGGGTANFAVGETITGGTSGATATVDYVGGNFLAISNVAVATFQAAETITGGTSAATATTSAVATTSTIDADYQTGQVVTDDGLGNLIGDVDAAGNNTINYDTGAFDVTFASAPIDGTNILANYYQLDRVVEYQLAGGDNGTAVTRAEISDPALEEPREGIYAFDDVEDPLNLVVPDFEGSLFVQADIVDYCEARNTRFAILGFANGTTKDAAIKYVLVDQAFDTKCAAIYWPNVYFVNELTDRPELVPVTPFIAGVYAKTAFNKNVGKSPGGIEDGALDANGTVGPEFGRQVNDIRVRDDLYQSRINPLFNSDATGFVVWGVRSLSTEARWRYLNARLLHNFLMDAIRRQLLWAVFENNGPQLWVKIETALKGFMGSLFRQGFFAGVTEDQAYFVVCNATNNNQATVDAGQVIIDIGFSPFKPAEFIIFRLSQPASTITV